MTTPNLHPIQDQELSKILESKADLPVQAGNGEASHSGLIWERLFGKDDPYGAINWEIRTARITKSSGEVVFEQEGVEVPDFWSQTATDIVASKYFRGRPGSPEREYSARQMVDRAALTIAGWGLRDGYFKNQEDYENFKQDLKFLLINQWAAFNSPVWFNVGVYERPQSSACFILSVEDNMQSILEWYRDEGWIFKFGSGAGINLSKLRSSKEPLSRGGRSSGPVSFMKGADGVANSIRSGGTTRRAAKIVILNIDHPDIKEFIYSKKIIEEMTRILEASGIKASIEGDLFNPYTLLPYQNANNSVRVTDEFMQKVESGEDWELKAITTGEVLEKVKAREIMGWIVDAAWYSADPGFQFDTTINDWHTCPASGRINASNPCSEYMFLDDSACNLASLNLIKFLRADSLFDTDSFKKAVDIMITAQEIIVGNSSYPTERITKNALDYRALGLGYANLGSLLMNMGLAYDSDDGRAIAATITSIMCGEAYLMSAKIAGILGPFAGYIPNQEPMLRIIKKHSSAAENLANNLSAVGNNQIAGQEKLAEETARVWQGALVLGEKHGFRNSQVTVLAPTGTIAFLMDCDTTGIEPELALIKYKKLVGGGVLKLINSQVPAALEHLGYDEQQISDISSYLLDKETIEGAPHLRPEHLPIFDCSFKAPSGSRSIHYMGHIKMMGAVQPFISGAISKCVTGDTLILTEKGILPINYFYENEKPDAFRQCSVRLASISKNQKTNLFYYGGQRSTICLRLTDGRTIEGTPNHRVKAMNKLGYDWKRLDEITTEDMVSIKLGTEVWSNNNFKIKFKHSLPYGSQKRVNIPAEITPRLARFMGYYIAEGNITRGNWTIHITNNCDEVLKKCQLITKVLFGIDGKVSTDPRNGVKTFHITSKSLVELFDYLGCTGSSSQKEIPFSILQSSRKVMKEFISGLWLDGYIRKDGMVAICLASQKLISQLQVIMNNFGIRCRIIQKHNKIYKRNYAELEIHGEDAKRFAYLFNLDEPKKVRSLARVKGKKGNVSAVWSDVISCYRDRMEAVIRAYSHTFLWKNVLDSRTQNVSWQTARKVYEQYFLPELKEIVDNNIHFEKVKNISYSVAEVYDFHVPGNNAFIGNGIINHNTVNLPNDATPDDIRNAFVQAWKNGLKSVAVYRDGCKSVQPLNTSEAVQEEELKKKEEQGLVEKIDGYTRIKLPNERPSITHKFSLANHEGYLTIGLYPDTMKPGETFITIAKEGSTISGLFDVIATLTSMCLQSGVPLKTLVRKFKDLRFEPAGFTSNPEIPFAKSFIDYIFKYLGHKFLSEKDEEEIFGSEHAQLKLTFGQNEEKKEEKLELPVTPATAVSAAAVWEQDQKEGHTDAPLCTDCGTIMFKTGSCFSCPNCFATTGVCN